ncbi:MAG TPA: hypothetical protein VFZ66_15700 [Herpetosiphonaceae bacterium]
MMYRLIRTAILSAMVWSAVIFSSQASAWGPSPAHARTMVGWHPGTIGLYQHHVSGNTDGGNPCSTAYCNMVSLRDRAVMWRSWWGHKGATATYANHTMIAAMEAMIWEHYHRYSVSAIAGGSHSTYSHHYNGDAFDVPEIAGTPVSYSDPHHNAFMQFCRNYGAQEVLGPGNAGHSNHVHCAKFAPYNVWN